MSWNRKPDSHIVSDIAFIITHSPAHDVISQVNYPNLFSGKCPNKLRYPSGSNLFTWPYKKNKPKTHEFLENTWKP
jgi:hypothetical protein